MTADNSAPHRYGSRAWLRISANPSTSTASAPT
eukprot:CAMPEP_0183345276 /NCGR_PEP_ID=MMETSP0164_2-20130417/10758_1 /TAXON_ID=221442 /ORGANISM="Coccolithus pelagicus ssp braarudi, Strain PLY182g" /LENGTH=32 /DNA_ID= /DNA_START= /DNA_END= /DNA_ORIENTATION=